MSPEPTGARATRVAATRESILTAAERLFAEQGLNKVSNRQVSEAAGQGNNTAVSYHFGGKEDLVRAIVRKHNAPMEERRMAMIEQAGDSGDLRDWVACLVVPYTEHLDSLGEPTYLARFSAQLMTDPVLRSIAIEETNATPSLSEAKKRFIASLDLPPEVLEERQEMARHLMIVVPALHERHLAVGRKPPRATWRATGTGLVDAIVGLYQGAVTPVD
ncbi:TetR/AcrR family transcriptional regulator [Salininema proteolyticum]|uniref:TetR/AcrR family transcriptional regulator n=1 Tax=Salininema proteolyticum TaxID=1607685 RepID=A0ABV8TVI2_9ACTN